MTESLRLEIYNAIKPYVSHNFVTLKEKEDLLDHILSLIQSRIPAEMPKFNAKKRIGLDLSLVEDQHNRFVRGFNEAIDQMKENLK
jgi:hypothetical protein